LIGKLRPVGHDWAGTIMRHRIAIAKTDLQIERCSAVMRELRPHIPAAGFLQRVKRQAKLGYRLAFLEAGGKVRAVAGYRVSEALAWGRFLYVDDLVTGQADRSEGYGGALLDWLVAEAVKQGCQELHLDSGVQRFGAHRFYLAKRMDITCHHFALRLTPTEAAYSRATRISPKPGKQRPSKTKRALLRP
jgi:hypothetical protein